MMLVFTRAGPLRLQLTPVDKPSHFLRAIYLGMLGPGGAMSGVGGATAPANCLEHIHYYLNLAVPHLVDFINRVVNKAESD